MMIYTEKLQKLKINFRYFQGHKAFEKLHGGASMNAATQLKSLIVLL